MSQQISLCSRVIVRSNLRKADSLRLTVSILWILLHKYSWTESSLRRQISKPTSCLFNFANTCGDPNLASSGAPLPRASVTPYIRIFGYLSIREILVVTLPDVCPPDRPIHPSVRTTGKPVWNVILSSRRVNLQHDTAHPFYGQLTAVKIGYPLASITSLYHCIMDSVVLPLRLRVFLKLSSDKLLVFNWSLAQFQFFSTGNRSTFSWLLKKKNSLRELFLDSPSNYWVRKAVSLWIQVLITLKVIKQTHG